MKKLSKTAKIRRFVLVVSVFVVILGVLVRTELKHHGVLGEFLISDDNECFKDLKCTPKWFNKYVQIHTAILGGILPLQVHILRGVNGVADRQRAITHMLLNSIISGKALFAEYPSPKDSEIDTIQDVFMPRYLFWNRTIATSNLTLTGDATVDLLMDYDPPLMRARSTDVAHISYIPDYLLSDVRDGGAYEDYQWYIRVYGHSAFPPKKKKRNVKRKQPKNRVPISRNSVLLSENEIAELLTYYNEQQYAVVIQESYALLGSGGWFMQSLAMHYLADSSVPSIIKQILGEMVQDGWLKIGRFTRVLHYLIQISPRLRTVFAKSLKSLLEQIAEKKHNAEITDFLKNPPNLVKLSVQTPNSFSSYLKSRMSLSIGQLVGLHFRFGDVQAYKILEPWYDNRHLVNDLQLKFFFRCADYFVWKLGFKDPVYVFFSDHGGVRKTVGDNPSLFTSYPLVVPHLSTGSTFHIYYHVDENQEERTIETWSEFLLLSSLDAIFGTDSQFSLTAAFLGEMKSSNHKIYFPYYGCLKPKFGLYIV